MRQITKILTLLFMCTSALAISDSQFDSMISNIQDEKFDLVELFLKDNEASSANDPEYFVVLLNYVLAKGEQRRIVVSKGEPSGDDLSLVSQESGNVEGFLGERVTYDKALILSGVNKTLVGLKSFSERLDIHFGIVAVAERIEAWELVADQLIAILKISKENNNQWKWGKVNSLSGKPKEFMIQNILSRTSKFFRLNTEIGDAQLLRVSNALIDYYPETIYGYANLGTYYSVTKDYDKAEKYFKKALSIDENDKIVLDNLQRLKELKKQ
jgi:tetratricopeptide (TPR) repeat protein